MQTCRLLNSVNFARESAVSFVVFQLFWYVTSSLFYVLSWMKSPWQENLGWIHSGCQHLAGKRVFVPWLAIVFTYVRILFSETTHRHGSMRFAAETTYLLVLESRGANRDSQAAVYSASVCDALRKMAESCGKEHRTAAIKCDISPSTEHLTGELAEFAGQDSQTSPVRNRYR